MKHHYIPPSEHTRAFTCPHCYAFAKQEWSVASTFHHRIDGLNVAQCDHCQKISIWFEGVMVYPDGAVAVLPNSDLDPDIASDFLEARMIVSRSPRGATALLRLCIQKLCKSLGLHGKDLNADIGELVKRGLNPKVQKSLDIVRVIGNEAVHPGQLDLRDNSETANKLFELVNFIADAMITQPKAIDAMFETLPEEKLEGIKRRDGR